MMSDPFSSVTVPNVIGLGRVDAEQRLASVPLRFRAQLVSSGTGGGAADAQTPAPGTSVIRYSVVTVRYPNPLLDSEEAVDGPEPESGLLEGIITSVLVGREGAGIGFSVQGLFPFSYFLYKESDPATREIYMRRGAMLAIAQRAFTGRDNVRILFNRRMVTDLWIFRPV
jgi:hypothetical protein